MVAINLSDTAGSADYVGMLPAQVFAGPPINGVPQKVWMPPVLMMALAQLYQANWAGRLPNVAPYALLWAKYADAGPLLTAGLAIVAPPGSVLAPEPPYSANGSAGVAAGTSNASH